MIIKHEDLSSEVYKRLKEMILARDFMPGQKLKQAHVAAMLGVSRMPLHKAFQMLENEMLVENKPRKGFYVTVIDNQRLIDAFEVREVLEGVAVRRATKIVTGKEIAYLRSRFRPFEGKAKINIKKYAGADQEFHDAILKISGNQILEKLEIISNTTLQTYRGGLIRQPEETLPEHMNIIGAMERGEADKAEYLVREHSRKSCDVLRQKEKI